ncbi:hypothetical protein [Gemella morbillorum]|uniref:hypothetical protein n=1 Tax=Gemella morbillorum TaxID=29391 RepID=UPI0023F3BC5B|nr:hypothetical protein [Gemella morbillorum]
MCLDDLVLRYKKYIGVISSSEEVLEKYSPWNDRNINALTKLFKEALEENSKSFSWLDIDSNFEKLKGDKYVRYGVPNHIRGDIQNSKLFLCLINPNIAMVKERKRGIKDFYSAAKKSSKSDESLNILGEHDELIINCSDIKKHIISTASSASILLQELKIIEETKSQAEAYYLTHYFSNICMAYLKIDKKVRTFTEELDNLTDLKKMSELIVNLEAYPFRSQRPNFGFVSSKTDVSMLSSRIIIWRIVKYLIGKESNSNSKPIFLFRRFNDAWLPSIRNVLKYDLKFTKEKSDELILELHKEFFLTIQKQDYRNASSSIGRESLYRNDEKLDKDEFNNLFQKLLS